jgi:hypothetical protein
MHNTTSFGVLAQSTERQRKKGYLFREKDTIKSHENPRHVVFCASGLSLIVALQYADVIAVCNVRRATLQTADSLLSLA